MVGFTGLSYRESKVLPRFLAHAPRPGVVGEGKLFPGGPVVCRGRKRTRAERDTQMNRQTNRQTDRRRESSTFEHICQETTALGVDSHNVRSSHTKTNISREVNEARLPDTCRRPRAFDLKKDENKTKSRRTQNTPSTKTKAAR